MKIIQEGQRSTMRVNCEACGSELEIDATDLKKEPDDAEGYGSYFYTCPCCHKTQYRRPNEVSPQIILEFKKWNMYK